MILLKSLLNFNRFIISSLNTIIGTDSEDNVDNIDNEDNNLNNPYIIDESDEDSDDLNTLNNINKDNLFYSETIGNVEDPY